MGSLVWFLSWANSLTLDTFVLFSSILSFLGLPVVAGEPVFVDQKQMEVTNPCLIVEILSNSTQTYDHDSKFRQYRSIPTFQEYILVYQHGYEVDHYVKESEDRWVLMTHKGEESVIKLTSMHLEIRLKDLYKRVKFD